MKNIIVGIDGGDTSKEAARQAMHVATAFGATLHFVTVVRKREVTKVASGSDHWIIDSVDQAQAKVKGFLEGEGFGGEHTVVALTGQIREQLVREAERVGADLIVVGNADARGIRGLLTSVGAGLRSHAPCSILIAKTV